MKRTFVTAVLVLAAAVSAFADVTIKSATAGKGLGMSAGTTSTMYIKGMKMRTDSVAGESTRTMIYDVDEQKMYMFDSKKKEADVFDMQAFGAEIAKSVQPGEMKASVKANGQTKPISGKTATGYDMEISVPTVIGGGDNGMKLTVMLTGPLWIVKGAPGTADYMTFYKGAIDKGFFFSDPRAAKSSPGQAKAMAEMYRQLAQTGGVPYETEMNIKMGGEGPMAGMMAKMGGVSMTSVVQSVETETLPAALFAPPADYKITVKK